MEHLILSCLESRLEEDGSLYGRFLLGPFRVGQGITIATALRRALLSELQGIAITAVDIEGAAHQYSSIVGVRESALDITLNLKGVVLAGKAIGELPATGYINVLGPKKVCGSDLRLPSGISCVNRNHHIATVSSNGSLLMKFVISEGKSYLIHHSAPVETLRPSNLGPTERGHIGGFPSPSFTRQEPAVSGPRPDFFASPQGGMGCDARYARHLTRKLALPSGAACDIISHVKERRLSAHSSKEGTVASKRTLLRFEEERLMPSDPSTPLPTPDPIGSMVEPLQREATADGVDLDNAPKQSSPVPKKDCQGRTVGAAPHARASTLLDDRGGDHRSRTAVGGPSRPHEGGLLEQGVRKDMFFAELAQKSRHLNRNSSHPGREGALEPAAGDGSKGFSSALGSNPLLPIDAVFAPINGVNFSLQTDDQWQEPKERVVLEISTNGSVSPRQAIHEAATCLVYMFSLLRQSQSVLPLASSLINKPQHEKLNKPQHEKRIDLPLAGVRGARDKAEASWDSHTNLPRQRDPGSRQAALVPAAGQGERTDLEDLHLSVEAYVALKQSRIHTLHDLVSSPPHWLGKVVGDKKEISLEISAKIKELSLQS